MSLPAQAPEPTPSHATLLDAQRYRVALLVLALGAFALRAIGLDSLGLAYDESASALMARATPPEIVDFHWNAAFEHPPLWVLLLHFWSKLVGQSEYALRYLPTVAGTLIVATVGRLVHTLWPRTRFLVLVSGLFVALSPVLIYYSQEARMYTLVVLLMLVATHMALRLRVQPSWPLVFAFWLVNWAMLGLHYYAALALAILAAVLGLEAMLFHPRQHEQLGVPQNVPWIILVVAAVGGVLPVIAWMLFSPGFHTTLGVVLDKAGEDPVSWHYFLGDLWRELTFGSIRWQPAYAEWGYALAPLVIIGALLALLRPATTVPARIGAWFIVAVVLLPIISGTLALRTLVPRYILWVVPHFYLLAALPAASLWRRHWPAKLASLTLVGFVVALEVVALQYYFGPYRKSEYREMTAYLAANGNPQQEILLLEAPRQHLLAKYYVPGTWQIHPMPTLPLPAYWPITAPPLVPEDEDDRIQTWLDEYQGFWVSYSSEAEVDRGEFLAKYLTAVAYRERCTQWLDARLCHYVSPRHLDPQPLPITSVLFGNELALTGAHATLLRPTPSHTTLLVQLDWHAQQKPSVDYKVALRLVAADGSTLDEADDFPIGPLLPPTTWNADDRKPGYVTLQVPPVSPSSGVPPGPIRIAISLYDANTLAPVAYTSLTGAPNIEIQTTDLLTLAELQLGDTIEVVPSDER